MAQDELSKSLSTEKPFLIPSNFLFLAKSLITIDGICKQLDPDFNFISYFEPMIEETISKTIDIGEMTRTSIEMPTRVRSINDAVKNMEKSRASVKRKLDRTNLELKNQKIGMALAILANASHDIPEVSLSCTILAIICMFRNR